MKIQEKENQLIEEFELFDDWMEKYEYIIDLGKDLGDFDVNHKTSENLISGCQSQVWIVSDMKDGLIYFYGDSDAIITKGLVAMVLRVFSGSSPKEVVENKLEFIDKIGLTEHLSPTRSNGLRSMIVEMKKEALKNLK